MTTSKQQLMAYLATLPDDVIIEVVVVTDVHRTTSVEWEQLDLAEHLNVSDCRDNQYILNPDRRKMYVRLGSI